MGRRPFSPAVVIVERHPFGVIASWRKLGWADFLDTDRAALQPLGGGPRRRPAARRSALAGTGRLALRPAQAPPAAEARRRHPHWLVVRHEELCAGPGSRPSAACAGRLGLSFTADTARYLAATNRPGDGYSTHRLWHEQVDGGRSRLTSAERALVEATLARFSGALPAPVADPYDEPVVGEPAVRLRTTTGMSRDVFRW